MFGDYLANPNLDFKINMPFFGSTSVSGGAGKLCETTVSDDCGHSLRHSLLFTLLNNA